LLASVVLITLLPARRRARAAASPLARLPFRIFFSVFSLARSLASFLFFDRGGRKEGRKGEGNRVGGKARNRAEPSLEAKRIKKNGGDTANPSPRNCRVSGASSVLVCAFSFQSALFPVRSDLGRLVRGRGGLVARLHAAFFRFGLRCGLRTTAFARRRSSSRRGAASTDH
jgi:hypothetical protein